MPYLGFVALAIVLILFVATSSIQLWKHRRNMSVDAVCALLAFAIILTMTLVGCVQTLYKLQ